MCRTRTCSGRQAQHLRYRIVAARLGGGRTSAGWRQSAKPRYVLGAGVVSGSASAAGWKSSMRLPAGSWARICRPPGPVTTSLRKGTPSATESRDLAVEFVGDQMDAVPPPGSGRAPSGIGRRRNSAARSEAPEDSRARRRRTRVPHSCSPRSRNGACRNRQRQRRRPLCSGHFTVSLGSI